MICLSKNELTVRVNIDALLGASLLTFHINLLANDFIMNDGLKEREKKKNFITFLLLLKKITLPLFYRSSWWSLSLILMVSPCISQVSY